ncbi:hypothetical protein [Labilibaculum sp.]|uniref:hypothetical protein n=1 Tax=Labilibaculum sp. TaxID=2060723 RepID=UPI0035678FE3
MKRNMLAFGTILFFSVALFSCSESSDSNTENDLTLEESLTAKTSTLSTAVSTITESKGYEILTLSDSDTKTSTEDDDSRFSAAITLDDIKGVYEYSAAIAEDTTETKMSYNSKFEKTGDSDNFVVKLPKEKANNPWNLYLEEEGDSTLVNDFVITTTQYNYSFSGGFEFNYLLNSSIEVEEEAAGELYVNWSISEDLNYEYESKYTFTDDYSVGIEFQYGDTVQYAYMLKNGEDVLFKEALSFYKNDEENGRSYEYTLAIGAIEIVKSSSSDSYLVYQDGELQEDAIIEVVSDTSESTDDEHVFCRKGLDLQITFADGSVVILSELLGDGTLDKMTEIFSSMYDMYFVNHVVNKVAHEAYYMNNSED